MNIGIVTTHSFPIPWKTHTGDVVILDLAAGLISLGHRVTVYAPAGTVVPEGCELLDMPCSFGQFPPSAEMCEQECFQKNAHALRAEEVVHDFSICKQVAWALIREGKRNVVATALGGMWRHLGRPMNVAVWSEAMRQRGLRGACDHEGTKFSQWMDCGQPPIADAKVVYGGIDCQLYDDPDEGLKKENFLLWMNRWHPAKGYAEAIDVAKATGMEVVMAGEHPDNETYEFQRQCALEALQMAKGFGNIHFEFLPPDPEHHEKKREMYRRAKALLYTVQFQEPFGLSQAESLASWTPVVGTRLGSVPEVIDDGLTGLVCYNNIASICEAAENVGKIDPKKCREIAVRRFSRVVMAKNYLRLYQNVVEGKNWG